MARQYPLPISAPPACCPVTLACLGLVQKTQQTLCSDGTVALCMIRHCCLLFGGAGLDLSVSFTRRHSKPMFRWNVCTVYDRTVLFALGSAGLNFSLCFLQAFGQSVHIGSDHFLANVGTIASPFNAFARIFWGFIADRYSYRVRTVQAGLALVFWNCRNFEL